jgi:hypothetical protein
MGSKMAMNPVKVPFINHNLKLNQMFVVIFLLFIINLKMVPAADLDN